ncbi:hypothetical protein, variant 1 [Fonticula alba]|nr:hypothetical protein, variant 1 [Fonticula alba]KCV70764.1 hypothetical protein, variant 1 [Fonticula alba]|eukprot:XP_009495280.1 hypothetical protein, variant 1 [Fonticula alba]
MTTLAVGVSLLVLSVIGTSGLLRTGRRVWRYFVPLSGRHPGDPGATPRTGATTPDPAVPADSTTHSTTSPLHWAASRVPQSLADLVSPEFPGDVGLPDLDALRAHAASSGAPGDIGGPDEQLLHLQRENASLVETLRDYHATVGRLMNKHKTLAASVQSDRQGLLAKIDHLAAENQGLREQVDQLQQVGLRLTDRLDRAHAIIRNAAALQSEDESAVNREMAALRRENESLRVLIGISEASLDRISSGSSLPGEAEAVSSSAGALNA